MNIKKILLPQKDDKQIKKLFDSFDSRTQDLIMLVKDCKNKLLIYDQVISKKIKLLNEYKQLHRKVQQLSPGAFEQFQYQYKREKADEKKQTEQKVQSASKRQHHDKNNHQYNSYQSHSKYIKKIDKRRK